MPVGLPVIALLAQTAAAASGGSVPLYGSAPPVATKQASAVTPPKATDRKCVTEARDPDSREIVVCAPKPEGYRIDPDVLAARKAKRQFMAGRPHNPHESFRDDKCRVVGAAPCLNPPMINLLAAAATAAEMAERLSKGQEIGSMFVTDPQPSEYQLYLEAKKQREAKEAEAVAKAKAKAAQSPPAVAP
jgi:hypothetical protein